MLIDLTTDEVIKTEAIDKISSILDYCLDESEEINISDSTLNTLVELCKNKKNFFDELRYKIYKLSGEDTKYLGKTEEDEKHKAILNLIDEIVDKKAEDKEKIYFEQIKKEGYLSYFVSEIFDKCVDIYWRNESDEKDLDYYLSILRLTEEQNRGLVIQEIIKETAYNYKEFMTDHKYYRYISGLYTGIWLLEYLFDLSKFPLVLLLFGSDDEYIRATSVIILKNVADTKFEHILSQVLKNEEVGLVRKASIEQIEEWQKCC